MFSAMHNFISPATYFQRAGLNIRQDFRELGFTEISCKVGDLNIRKNAFGRLIVADSLEILNQFQQKSREKEIKWEREMKR